MTDDMIRFGIIGTGLMGMEHIANLAAIDGAVITAIADPNATSRTHAAAAVGLDSEQVFDSHLALLGSNLCDAVIVATPNHTHRDVLLDVIAADIHFLTEKPLCTSVAECQEVVGAAAGMRSIAWMGLEYRYMPATAELLRRVRDGAVGTVHMVAIREHRYPFLTKVADWNRFRTNTGGTLVEKCCHFFDLMNLIAADQPVRVFASGAQRVNHLDERYEMGTPDIIDSAYVIVEYRSGVRAMLDLCMFAEGSKNEQEIAVTGDLAKIEAHLIPDSIVRLGDRDGARIVEEKVVDERILVEGGHAGSSFLEALDFVTAIRDGSPPKVTLQEGLDAVAIGEAAHLSIDEGRPIELAEVL